MAVPAPATGSSTTARPHPQHPNGSTPCFRSDFSGWRDADLYPLAAPRAAPDQTITRSFRAGLRTRAVFLRARRTRSSRRRRARRFLFSACRIGAPLELGRWGRAMMMAVPAPATGSSTTARPHPQHPNGSTPCFRSDFSGWRDADLYPLAAPRAAPDQTITRSFRAGLRTRAVFLRARRTRSSRRRRARRFLFSACRIGAPLELGRWGRAMMMAVPAPATGSSTTARPHPQHPNGSTPCFRSDFSGWRDADLYPLAAPRAAPDQTITRSFRAGLRTRAVFLRARRTRSSRRRRARRFLFSACRIGAPLELGRWGRAMMMAVPAPATGSSTTARPHPQHPNGSTPCFRSDFSGWRDADLYPLAAPRAAPDQTITRSFRAGLRTRAVFLRARRTRSSRRRRARRFLFSACRIGAPLELGRWGRAMMMAVPAPATGSSTTARPHPQHPNGSTPCFRSDFSGWRDADLYPLAAPRAAPDQTITRSFRAGLRTRAVFLRARRTRSSRRRRARRFLFSACRIGAPLELGRWGRAMMMAVPAPATGSSTTARPHPQHPNGSTPCFRSDFSGWRDADLYPLAAPRAAPDQTITRKQGDC